MCFIFIEDIFGFNKGYNIMGSTSTETTIPRTPRLSNDILGNTTVRALCVVLVFVLLVVIGSAAVPVVYDDANTTSEDTPTIIKVAK